MLGQATSPAEVLAGALGGELVGREHRSFDELRTVFNGMIDRRPAVIVRPTGAADVIAAVDYARAEGLKVAVRSGGHSVAGMGTCDDGVLLDLSLMKGVRVDPRRRTARAATGTLWGQFDHETQAFGLATPGGRATTTGIGGFTLGGGYGWISPKYGLACDNLLSADVVTADGELVTASESENEELFWGIRGGGGNFGVATSLEFRLHPVGPTIVAGLLIWPLEQAREVARAWRDLMDGAPDELSGALGLIPAAPPEDFVPADLQGQPALGMFLCWCGDVDAGLDAIKPMKDLEPPVDLAGPMPYTAFQAMIDPMAPSGFRNYWRGEHLRELGDEAIDAYVDNAPVGMHELSMAVLFHHGGAVGRVPPEATASVHRDAEYMFHPIACWESPGDDARHLSWLHRASDAMQEFATGGLYLNFMPDEGEERVKAGYQQETWKRLVALKDRYDPTNMFCFNSNIRPTVRAQRAAGGDPPR